MNIRLKSDLRYFLCLNLFNFLLLWLTLLFVFLRILTYFLIFCFLRDLIRFRLISLIFLNSLNLFRCFFLILLNFLRRSFLVVLSLDLFNALEMSHIFINGLNSFVCFIEKLTQPLDPILQLRNPCKFFIDNFTLIHCDRCRIIDILSFRQTSIQNTIQLFL